MFSPKLFWYWNYICSTTMKSIRYSVNMKFKYLHFFYILIRKDFFLLQKISIIENIIAMDENAKILVISSLNDLNTALRAIEAGALGFLHKPFSPDELSNKIKEILF